jgi:magnesium transporter
MITIHAWNAASKTAAAVTVEELLSRKAVLLAEGNVVWIDLSNPSDAEERLVLEQFYKIHSLTFEDITRLRREPNAPPHFPKVEEFPDYLFVIVNPLTQEFQRNLGAANGHYRSPALTQLSAVLTSNLLVTHHYAPLACVDEANTFMHRHETQFERGPSYLFHLVLDHTVDEFIPVLDTLEETLDRLEAVILRKPQASIYVRLLHLKRVIIVLRKTLIAEREVLVRLARGEFGLVGTRETVYYRNVYDHLVRFTELIESSREMVTDLMQTFLSAQANHLNQIIKVLTMISIVVLPMSLIASIYGMNLKPLIPGEDNPYGFFIALGMMLVSGLAALAFFFWKRWL